MKEQSCLCQESMLSKMNSVKYFKQYCLRYWLCTCKQMAYEVENQRGTIKSGEKKKKKIE